MVPFVIEGSLAIQTVRWAVAQRNHETAPALRDAIVARIPDDASCVVLALSVEETEHLVGVLWDFSRSLLNWYHHQAMAEETRSVMERQIPLIRNLLTKLAGNYARVDALATAKMIDRLMKEYPV